MLIFGAVAAYESAKLPFGTVHSPGQGFFPWWISAVIFLLALLLLFQALTSPSSVARERSGRIAKVAALLVILAAYTFLLEPLGYPLCTFLLVLFIRFARFSSCCSCCARPIRNDGRLLSAWR